MLDGDDLRASKAADTDSDTSIEASGSPSHQLPARPILEAATVQLWDPEAFKMEKQLQEAVRNHGSVDLMKCMERGCFVAVKRMPNRWITGSAEEFAKKYPRSSERPWFDIGLVTYLHGRGFPYVCEALGVYQDPENTYVVTSLASEGDLFAWCDRLKGYGKAREAAIRPVARQSMSAICWLHDLGIAHRDISLENMLLTKEGGELRVKVIDFGMGTLTRMCTNEVRGKQSYQAPEMHGCESYDAFLTDAFALGVVLFCLASQDYPWQATVGSRCQLFQFIEVRGFRAFLERRKLRKGTGERLADVFTESFQNLVEGLVSLKPETRFSLGERCWRKGTADPRLSVWDMPWMDEWES